MDLILQSLGFNMDQLKVGREAFVNMLSGSLDKLNEVSE